MIMLSFLALTAIHPPRHAPSHLGIEAVTLLPLKIGTTFSLHPQPDYIPCRRRVYSCLGPDACCSLPEDLKARAFMPGMSQLQPPTSFPSRQL